MSLPSYQEAIATPEPLHFVKCWITDEKDLFRLCLVSKRFYGIFAPVLWDEPTKALHPPCDPYQKYDLFAKNVRKARYVVRSLVTTLDFRAMRLGRPFTPMQNVYVRQDPCSLLPDGPDHYLWFHRVAASLPSLKFIIVDGISGFSSKAASLDKAVQIRLRNPTHSDDGQYFFTSNTTNIPSLATSDASRSIRVPLTEKHVAVALENDNMNLSFSRDRSFMPVLLSAANCPSLESVAVTSREWSNELLYLDVSGSSKCRLRELFSRHDLPNLRILKIQNLRITNDELIPILEDLGTRVFSLDLRDNMLTDKIIKYLLKHNFLDPFEQRRNTLPSMDRDGNLIIYTPSNSRPTSPDRYMEDAPEYSERRDVSEEQETSVIDNGRVKLRPDDVDAVLKMLKEKDTLKAIFRHGGLDGNLLTRKTGLTNLYLSGNKFSPDALTPLLTGTNRLQLLDFGSAVQVSHRFSSRYPNVRLECQPESVKFLAPAVSQRLEWLRIHHSIVTHTPTIMTIGEYHLSEKKKIHLSEETYAIEEMLVWPVEFLPDINPRIKYLCLTSVPHKSLGLVIQKLLKLLRAAAVQESLIAKATPPDGSRRNAQMLCGLCVLRLEFAQKTLNLRKASTFGPSISQQQDADNFLNESKNDFSFFDDATQSPEGTMQRDFSFFSGEGISQSRTRSMSQSTIGDVETTMLRDVKDELRAYRLKTKAAFEDEQRRLGPGVQVPLGSPHYHWTGTLDIV